MNLSATTLRGRFVQLEPVETHHRTEMAEPASDSRIWENTPLGASFDHYFNTLVLEEWPAVKAGLEERLRTA